MKLSSYFKIKYVNNFSLFQNKMIDLVSFTQKYYNLWYYIQFDITALTITYVVPILKTDLNFINLMQF